MTSLVLNFIAFSSPAKKIKKQITVEPEDKYLNFPIRGWDLNIMNPFKRDPYLQSNVIARSGTEI